MSWRGDPRDRESDTGRGTAPEAGAVGLDEDPTERFPVRQDTFEVRADTTDEPRRFTPFLAAAAAVGVVAVLALLVVVLSGGGGPPGSPPGSRGSLGQDLAASLGTTDRVARPSGDDESPGTALPPFSDIVCSEPVDGFAARQSLIEAFRDECDSAMDTVLSAEAIDPTQVLEAAWAYRVQDAAAPAAGPLGEVYLVLEGERRVRFYLVSFDADTGAAVIAGRFTRVREISPTVVFRWSRDAV